MTKLISSIFCCIFLASAAIAADGAFEVSSPDKEITAKVWVDEEGSVLYIVSRNNEVVLEPSRLGLIREDEDFSKNLSLIAVSPISVVTDQYQLYSGKRRLNTYQANRRVYHLKSSSGKLLDVIFQVSDDGVAFRYYFPETSNEIKKIKEEITSFDFNEKAKGWLQPMSDAKTGWSQVNPAYEEYYLQGIPVGTPSPIKAGWAYPSLFQTGEHWVLITESFPNGNYCATRLRAESPDGAYTIGFPQPQEIFPDGALYPQSMLPWYSPWRIITIGSLATIVESSLGTDLAEPAVALDTSFIRPGISSWSWALLKDDSTIYNVQKRFIDYAANMNWEYTLVDGEWDWRIGYDSVKLLVDYAKAKDVGVLLWYNSAGKWNTAYQTPKHRLLNHEVRVEEFSRIHKIGVKGIKVDFFGGDGQSMIQYYHDILRDAATYQLLVNCHGSTLPRGLHRTYPNLVTMEAVKGFEFRTFGDQNNENIQPAFCATLPYARNAFDPMDYTPLAVGEIPGVERKTSNGFELALPVVFFSGIQHIAALPPVVNKVPDYVKEYLRELPPSWDDTRFVAGFPGKLAVIARKAGNKWYVAGINGEAVEKELELDLSFLENYKSGQMITDGKKAFSFAKSKIDPKKNTSITLQPNGGFVMVFEDNGHERKAD